MTLPAVGASESSFSEPAMNEEHGHLDGKPQKQRQEDPELDLRRILHLHQSQHVVCAPDVVQGQNPNEQQQAPRQAEQDELDRRLGPLGASQNAIMKYVGIIVISQKKKKRKASRAVNTPVTAPSTRRMSIMKAFTFVAMLRQEPSTHKGTGNAVSRTSGKLIPSTPTAYWVPTGRYPLHAVHELRPAGRVVKAHPQPHREPQREQGDAEGHPANGLDIAPACTDREESNDHQPDERGRRNPN